ncbi:NTP pyrophosphohydrolase [Rhizobium leguminosarum bv. trifolii WSM2297]|uniref:NTP pyrophosphohydrolase n=1 Tax=Rhizobium leguminosarum bv. trifolii WSM2297 TaxID=754762 RepID=J0CU10_RHILT|nr:NUDIX hydrolase [Rhizobium leguminosarum]EJC83335.1 NTP pyrophosphohydrolase [Rhizobium leguminosarum bv. trifolii WSM2297]EJC85070.1 NTP pyrophosphohydrolase [Rhizobium leguminosarum bv. trifolii WSM2297]
MNAKKTRSYLSRLAAGAEQLFRGEAMEQFAAICYRRIDENAVQVLLITSRDSGRWVIPKGWPISALSPHQVAEREAWEEAGVIGKAKKRPFGYYTYIKTLDTGERVPSIVQVHLLEAKKTDENFPEEKQRSSQWLSPFEAAGLVREPELKSLLKKVEKAIARSRQADIKKS